MTYGELINHIKEDVVNDVDVSYGRYSIKDEQFLLIG